MPQHVLVITLGPVQDFIASARRCQDLWFGSWLLSDLSRAVALRVDAFAGGGALVFPSEAGNEAVAVANKIVALLPANCDPRQTAEAGRAAMVGRIQNLANQVFKDLKPHEWDRELAMKQLDDVIEYIWVAAPLEDGDYAKARSKAERLLGARKNTKDWRPVPMTRVNRSKCSIDGARESILEDSLYKSDDPSVADFRKRFRLKKSERLCGVCLLKRLGEDVGLSAEFTSRPVFHSNSHVAAEPVFERVNGLKDKGTMAAKRYVEALASPDIGIDFNRYPHLQRNFGLEGYLLYEERLADAIESYSKVAKEKQPEAAEKSRAALDDFLKAIGHVGPTPAYYAMLLADGDSMGIAINSLKDPDHHRQLSRALEQFALGCRDIVKDHGGSFIYSGGDDVLALLPLHSALDCADELQQSFRKHLEEKGPTLETLPTLSVGLGVAHHLEAMTEVRELAKDAEKLAKKRRNSLAIIVSKRSGGNIEVTGQWTAPNPMHKRIDQWCKRLDDEELPHGVAFELEEAMVPFELASDDERRGFKDVITALVKRVLGRKRADGGTTPLDDDTTNLLQDVLDEGTDPVKGVWQLSREIQIARLVLEARQCAYPKETT